MTKEQAEGYIQRRTQLLERALDRACEAEAKAIEFPDTAHFFQEKIEANLKVALRCEQQILVASEMRYG